MKNLQIENITTIEDWNVLFFEDANSYFFDQNVQIDIIGENEASYMVINIYANESSTTEYLFFPREESDVGNARIYIFDFLKTLNFSLKKLLQWLIDANFQETEFGMAVDIGEIIISRSNFKFQN